MVTITDVLQIFVGGFQQKCNLEYIMR